MRLVLDTNVLISAVLRSESWPAAIVRSLEGTHRMSQSEATARECLSVLARPKISRHVTPMAAWHLERLVRSAEVVMVTTRLALCRDARDDMFLDLATDGRADALISGDRDLLWLGQVGAIPIVSPEAFFRIASFPHDHG